MYNNITWYAIVLLLFAMVINPVAAEEPAGNTFDQNIEEAKAILTQYKVCSMHSSRIRGEYSILNWRKRLHVCLLESSVA